MRSRCGLQRLAVVHRLSDVAATGGCCYRNTVLFRPSKCINTVTHSSLHLVKFQNCSEPPNIMIDMRLLHRLAVVAATGGCCRDWRMLQRLTDVAAPGECCSDWRLLQRLSVVAATDSCCCRNTIFFLRSKCIDTVTRIIGSCETSSRR